MRKTDDYPDIYKTTASPEIGNKYHLSWANPGCVWVLDSFLPDGYKCILRTPKSKKRITAQLSDLRLLSEDAFNYKPN